MSSRAVTPESFGREVLGPIVAEFCLRLWSLGTLMERGSDVSLLFCARGGLRMQLAYERFLEATAYTSPVRVAPLMVSRVVAIRPSLVLGAGADTLLPAAAETLRYEFARGSLSGVATAMAGVIPAPRHEWDAPFTPRGFADLLRHPDGAQVVEALGAQASLFGRHVRETMGSAGHGVLVDTGLYGTTRQLLAEGLPDLEFSSALIARSFRPGLATRHSKTYGLSVEAESYSPIERRTSILRYWQFTEWLLEPELPSVRTFAVERGRVRSNLEIDGWQERIAPAPGSAFAGVLDYLGALPHAPAARIVVDADRAWGEFRKAVVWPRREQVGALRVGTRSHDFGNDGTWIARPWRGPVGALRGTSMWREGEIGESGSRLRRPLLAALETAYGVRRLGRSITGRSRMR